MLTIWFRVRLGNDTFVQVSKALEHNPNNTRLNEGQKSRVHLRMECIKGWKHCKRYLRYDIWVVLMGVQ